MDNTTTSLIEYLKQCGFDFKENYTVPIDPQQASYDSVQGFIREQKKKNEFENKMCETKIF